MDNSCSICLIQYIPIEQKCITNCNHSFCKSCLDTWFDEGKNSCPICRQVIQYFNYNNQLVRVIFNNTINLNNTINDNTMYMITMNRYTILQGIIVSFGIAILAITTLYINSINRINKLTDLNHECNEKINNLYFIDFYNNDVLRTCLMPLYYITNCFQS